MIKSNKQVHIIDVPTARRNSFLVAIANENFRYLKLAHRHHQKSFKSLNDLNLCGLIKNYYMFIRTDEFTVKMQVMSDILMSNLR